jgi:hypothetical protein
MTPYYEKANCDHLYENGGASEQDLNKPIKEGPINFSFIKTKLFSLLDHLGLNYAKETNDGRGEEL